MLTGVARRRAQREAFRYPTPSFEQLYFPWLCPAQLRYQERCQSTASTGVGPRAGLLRERHQRQRGTGYVSKDTTRRLAIAVGEYYTSQEDFVPFDRAPPSSSPQFLNNPFLNNASYLSNLRPFDPEQPLVVNDPPSAAAVPRLRNGNNVGPGGDPTELLPNLLACLRVGNLDRAAVLVKRLGKAFVSNAPEVQHAHNLYIKALVETFLKKQPGSEVTIRDVQRWFEVEMRGNGVPADALTYCLLIKAAFSELEGPKLDRTIRRYLDLARFSGPDTQEQVLTWEHYTDNQWDHLIRLVSPEFEVPIEELPQQQSEASIAGLSDPVTPSVPEVRPVEQKGLGLKALKRSLSIFSAAEDMQYPHDMEGSREEKDQIFAYKRQVRLEEDSLASAIERWRQENETMAQMGISPALQKKSVGALMWQWHCVLKPLIQQELDEHEVLEAKQDKSEEDYDRLRFAPYLALLAPEKTAAVTILACVKAVSTRDITHGLKVASVVTSIGKHVEYEANAESLNKSAITDTWGSQSSAERQRKLAKLLRRRRGRSSPKESAKATEGVIAVEDQALALEWTTLVRVKLGAFLVTKLVEAAKIAAVRTDQKTGQTMTQMQPAFFHTYHMENGKSFGVIRPNNELIAILKKEPPQAAIVKHLPMVVQPKPWTGFKEGGFLRHPVPVVRTNDNDQERYVRAAARKGDMDQVFAGLDVLGKTAWRINRDVFNIMLEIWNRGERAGKIVPENPNIPLPPEPANPQDPVARRRWVATLKQIEDEKMGMHSTRCFQNFQLEVARSYLNEIFYYPHNVDFRGRAYPLPPYLNHMGADHARGLLMFAKGKELGSTGLRWLKIQLANVFGYDKASLKDREDFAQEHVADVYDSAMNPVNGKRWWLKAEDPWQCLATCFELKNALESSDPTQFVSHLPIHQDGTCNGLQHYAALGGDTLGARQVNLVPGDKPADIYTAVAELVKESIAKDAARGNQMAKLLEGKITRKVVKTTVMTNVYGVTFMGAKEQVREKLEEIIPRKSDSSLNYHTLSMYIARGIFKALSSMFKGAQDIQFWLGECASRICSSVTPASLDRLEKDQAGVKLELESNSARYSQSRKLKAKETPAFRSTVIWTTPLKMPIVQHYRKAKSAAIVTNLQRISITATRPFDPVSRRKQLQGFPPNFIHSLDATHMLLSALKCDEAGLTFAAVHDSFWTHASDVSVMNRVLRDAFVRMHSEDIIGRLSAEFAARYRGHMYQAAVYVKSPVGQKIAAHRATHKRTGDRSITELVEERQRQKLLNSSNEEERKRGMEMVTPASILEAADDESAMLPPEEIKGTGLGDVPGVLNRREALRSDSQDKTEATAKDNIDEIIDAVDPTSAQYKAISYHDVMKLREARKKKWAHDPDKKKIHVWLPLKFPPVPEKGDFDVSRLRNSTYFFS